MEAGSSLTIGEYLVQSRNARRLSLAEVSQDLHIRQEYLEALEQNAWDKLPGEIYGQGFLRSYARYLDLDAEALVAYRKRLRGQEESVAAAEAPAVRAELPVLSRRERRAATPTRVRATPRRASRSRSPEPSPLDSGRTIIGVVVILVILTVAGLFTLHRPASHPTAAIQTPRKSTTRPKHHKASKRPPKSRPPAHPVKPASPAVTLTASNPPAGTATYNVSASPVDVTFHFRGLCWVEVWQNGVTKNPSGVTYSAGQSLTVSASSSVAVKLGTRAVSVTVGGRSVPLPDAPTYPLYLTYQHS